MNDKAVLFDALLINVPVLEIEDDSKQPPGGLVSIATYTSQKGYNIQVCDLAGIAEDKLLERISAASVYGFSVYTVTYQRSLRLLKELRERFPNALFVAGGPHASALPEEVKRDFDCVVVGEGEEVFWEILEKIKRKQRKSIPPIIHANPILDLDSLPFPDFYRFCDLNRYSRRLKGIPVISLDSSRGCNNRCHFCNSRVITRGNWRARSPENVTREILWHRERGWRAFRFNDDNFLTDEDRTLRICHLLTSHDIRFRIFCRAESLKEKVCAALKEAGCIHISVGIESLSPRMLSLMGKATRLDTIYKGINAAKEAGITLRGFFLTGFPGETDETVNETINTLQHLPLDEAVCYSTIPYPGTDLFMEPERYGITWIDPDFSKYIQVGRNRSAGFVMETKTFAIDKVKEWRERYMKKFEELNMGWSDSNDG